MGMYSVYLKDWFRIFPKSQIHVLRTEDYHVSMETELKKIFTFLERGMCKQQTALSRIDVVILVK